MRKTPAVLGPVASLAGRDLGFHIPMKAFLAIAATLCLAAAPLHSILGERLIFGPLFKQQLPELLGSAALTKQVLRLFWHVIGIAWWGLAALLALLATRPGLDETLYRAGAIIALTFLASSIYALVQTRGRHFAWVVFLAIAACTWLGIRSY